MQSQPFVGRSLPVQGKVQVSPGLLLLLPAALLLLPLRWVLAWVLAVVIHETGHYLAFRLCVIPIYGLRISPLGVLLQTGDLQFRETLICALAGPLFALLFTVLSPIMPRVALCIFFQSIFNLLPIYPLDGGRVLRVILLKFLSVRTACFVEWVMTALVFAAVIYVLYILKMGVVPILLVIVIFAQKFLANRDNTRYNRGEKRF